MERQELMIQAAAWMATRGWKQKLGKRRDFEQSLFEHSLIELDVFLELCPILASPQHYSLSDAEQKILTAAIVVHDVGKEADAWQAYIGNKGPSVPHVIPELTRAVIPQLCSALGLEGLGDSIQRIMAHCAEFHHNRPGRSDGAFLEAMLTGGSDRFLTLAHLVKAIDHLCSAPSASEAVEVIKQEPSLGRHLIVTSHEAMVRGVSTTFVHRAARDAFQQRGWRPLLYFFNATVYCADPNDYPLIPATDDIRSFLKTEIDTAIARDVTSLMVGSPTGNILPKPDLFAFAESHKYLQKAAEKIHSQSFGKKKLAVRRKVVEDYWKLKGKDSKPTDREVEEEAGRISVAQPEMLVFKFFKAMIDPDKVKAVDEKGVVLAKKLYEETFGTGSWAALQSTSTLMPAKDMAKTVDYFWALSGAAINRPNVQSVRELPDQARSGLLIDLLDGIAQKVYAAVAHPSPREKLSQDMAEAFVNDLLQPSVRGDVQILANAQLAHYAQSKPFAGKESAKGVYFCPICNAPFDSENGKKASADFIDNPQTHTNRGVAYGSFGYIMVCTTCYYERLLLQILLGSRPAEMITLLPRLNLGPRKGEQFVQKVKEWIEAAKGQMRGETGNLEFGFSLGLTDQVARHLGNRDPFTLRSEELLSLFSYRFASDTQKKRRQEALRRLKEEFDDDLNALNLASNDTFSTWEGAVEALIANRLDQQECKAIRREVFRLYETVHLICQTPNLVFIPVTYEIAAGNDESETSKGLRRLYVALVLSLVFDAAVAIHKEGEQVDFQSGVRAAYVPPVPAVRSLVGHDWLPITEAKRWLTAIGSASLLVRDTGLPTRSALYQILAADPAEQIARRIEEGGDRNLTLNHVHLIEQLPGFHRSKDREVRP
ncbi:MAG: hypothetical protein HY268_22855 [Deltaproteobacteria bacterium]|nr:hypothetical protein [Deltaproteobacteria bacterium]